MNSNMQKFKTSNIKKHQNPTIQQFRHLKIQKRNAKAKNTKISEFEK